MTTKRLTWIYLTSYLIGGELGLLLIPDIFMSLLLSFTPSILNVRNGSFPDIRERLLSATSRRSWIRRQWSDDVSLNDRFRLGAAGQIIELRQAENDPLRTLRMLGVNDRSKDMKMSGINSNPSPPNQVAR